MSTYYDTDQDTNIFVARPKGFASSKTFLEVWKFLDKDVYAQAVKDIGRDGEIPPYYEELFNLKVTFQDFITKFIGDWDAFIQILKNGQTDFMDDIPLKSEQVIKAFDFGIKSEGRRTNKTFNRPGGLYHVEHDQFTSMHHEVDRYMYDALTSFETHNNSLDIYFSPARLPRAILWSLVWSKYIEANTPDYRIMIRAFKDWKKMIQISNLLN